MNLFLIGYRGTGKTTVSRLVAQRLGWPWLDTDQEIEQRAGKTIAEIFSQDGEQAFRDWESQVLADLAGRTNHVLSLGGGIVLREQNRKMLADGKTLWLTATAETIYDRISADSSTAASRPNLTTGGGIAEVRQLLATRAPIYRQCADLIVDTENKLAAEVADEIVQSLQLKSLG